nr:family 20 glycosylhydrolase [Candidatus Sigynarchaeota archaeon]
MKYAVLWGLGEANDRPGVEGRLFLCPRPRKIEFSGEMVEIIATTTFDTSAHEDSYLHAQLDDEIVSYKRDPLQIARIDEDEDAASIIEKLGVNVTVIGEEGFHMETKDDILIIFANATAGLFYGLQLLYQLIIEDEGRLFLPRVIVDDYPKMAIRGLSQDVARGQSPSVEAIKRHIKLMSRFRLNMYQIYLEDMFSFAKYPQIGHDRGPITPADIKEIEAFASKYHVEFVPVFQNLGHCENMLLDPEIKKMAEFPGAATLNIASPKTYEFLHDLFSEIAPSFSSKKFHIGCDETWDLGQYRCRDLVAKKGMGKTLLDHYVWVINELKKYGKTTFFLYHDIAAKYDEVLQGLPKENLLMVFWEYDIRDDWPEIDRIASFGVPFVVSSSTLGWMKPFPDVLSSFESNRKLIDNGRRKGAIGEINSAWGDNGQENFHENNIMSFSYASAYAWNEEGFNDETFVSAYFKALFGIADEKLAELFDATCSIHKAFPSRYLRNWLGFLWRHPYHSPALDNVHPLLKEEEHWDIHEDLIYHENDMEEQKSLCEKIISLVTELKLIVKHDAINLEYYEFAGRLLRYFIRKIQTTAKVTNLCKEGLDDEKAAMVVNLIEQIIPDIKDLQQRFQDLWLNCASRPMLDRILRFYDWQVYWQEQKAEQVKQGIAWVNPYLESEWIAFPENIQTQDPRFFRKVIELTADELSNLASAYLELGPGNYAVMYVNGVEVGFSQCSYHGAAPVMDHSIEYWNILPLLKPGKNLLAVRCTCYFLGQPVINIYAELKANDGSIRKVLSDATWLATDKEMKGWNMDPAFDDAGWKDAASKGRPPKYMGEISLPRFDIGWKSKITHHGFCRILRAKARNKEPPSEFFDDMQYFDGSIL